MTWLAEACAHAGSVCNHDALTSVAISLEFSRLSTRWRQRRYPCLEFGQTVHRHVGLPGSFLSSSDLAN